MCLQCRGSRQEPQNVVQLLKCYLRAAELEIRTAEGSLRSDLDVKGLKAQDLGRIEGLEAREREREELVAELVPAMESRGYETVGEGCKREGRECKEDTGRTERF
jgi:hypothetical protein